MDRHKQASWTDAELANLLSRYFGEKLSPAQLRRLVADVAVDLAERGQPGRGDAETRGRGEGEAETPSDTEPDR